MFNMVARAHTYPAQCNAASEQHPEGWRIVDPPPCPGGSTHRWVLLTPTVHRCPKGMAVGGPCDQTAQQYSAETPKHGSGAMSIQGKNCNKIHENHDDQCSVKCRIFRRISTEVKNAKTLTIVVHVRCLARRREPTQPIDVEKRVGESDDKSVMNRQARNVAQV